MQTDMKDASDRAQVADPTPDQPQLDGAVSGISSLPDEQQYDHAMDQYSKCMVERITPQCTEHSPVRRPDRTAGSGLILLPWFLGDQVIGGW